jgi:uncharacterized cupin superfamily protein
MTIAPGDFRGRSDKSSSRGGPWLYVVAGTGTAVVNRKGVALKAGTLLQGHKDRHEIKTTGRALLWTLNFNRPPGYTKNGEELPAAKP